MKRLYFRITAEKATTQAARDSLEALAELAASYEEADASYPDRVNASKAARGEKPTKISRSTRETLSSLEADRTELDDDLARQLRALPSAESIVRALHQGMSADLPRAGKMLKYFHPGDLSIDRGMADMKAQLVCAMAGFLAQHGNDG